MRLLGKVRVSMKDEWRGFILQWVIPAGIFTVVLAFLFASFSADIKRETVTNYENSLINITSDYSKTVNTSIRATSSVGFAAAEVIEAGSLNQSGIKAALEAITDNTDAYLALLSDKNGKVISTSDEVTDISGLDYFEHILSQWSLEKFFVLDDGITGSKAYVLSIDVDDEKYEKLFIYYPLTGANTRKYVPVETEQDSMGFAMLIDDEGTIFSSTGSNESLITGQNLWDNVIKDVNASTLSRNRTRLKSGSTGSFEGKINNRKYFITYAPVGNSDFYLIVNYSNSNVTKQEKKLIGSSVAKLTWCTVLTGAFIILVTVLNLLRAIATQKNSTDLKDKANHDQLTGLKNKIATEREIKDYITEYPDTLAMLFIIDLDNFKKINDTMGHAFGDEVLRELGKNIGINFRVSDVIGRTGGDEFTIFLKNLKEDANCIREAQKLIYFFRHFQVGDYVKYSVTASIGAAVYPAHGADFETLYKAADAAVYKSKKRGKNQLSFYDDRDKTPEEVAEADAHHISLEREPSPELNDVKDDFKAMDVKEDFDLDDIPAKDGKEDW